MPVDPFLEPLIANLPPFPDHVDDWDAFRAQEQAGADTLVDELTEPGPHVKECRTVTIAVDGGTIDLVIYTPVGDGRHPAHLYLHGGGWVSGTIHSPFIDITCRERAAGAGCVVIAVNYRKAPEHKFPVGLHDCHAALIWAVEHADELGIQPGRITIGGGSAGANLAAALALKARDEGGPAIAFQLLEVPALDLTGSLPSHHTHGTGYGLEQKAIKSLVDLYLRSPDQVTNPYASPLLAPDLTKLPPAHIMSAEYDPLRDDGQQYAERLNDAGVPATFTLGQGHIHISPAFTKVMASARTWRDEAIAALKRVNEQANDATA